jgi:hypothetical protein
LGNLHDLSDLTRNTERMTAADAEGLGYTVPSSERPPYDSLPQPVRDMFDRFKADPSMDAFDKLYEIHDMTRSLLERTEQNPLTDRDQDFASILRAGRGDCDDFVIVERALIEYGNQQGAFNPPMDVGIVGGGVTYNWTNRDGTPGANTIDHNYIVAHQGGDYFILDGNSTQPSNVKADGEVGVFLEGSDGSQIPADIQFDRVDVYINSDGISMNQNGATPPAVLEQRLAPAVPAAP